MPSLHCAAATNRCATASGRRFDRLMWFCNVERHGPRCFIGAPRKSPRNSRISALQKRPFQKWTCNRRVVSPSESSTCTPIAIESTRWHDRSRTGGLYRDSHSVHDSDSSAYLRPQRCFSVVEQNLSGALFVLQSNSLKSFRARRIGLCHGALRMNPLTRVRDGATDGTAPTDNRVGVQRLGLIVRHGGDPEE
jgi:hypothetical protein